MISVFGRKDKGEGILHNFTDGGEGVSGFKVPHSKEWREKVSKAMKGKYVGKKHSAQSKENMRNAHLGKVQTPESNKKRSEALKGRKKSTETIEKIRAANTGKKNSEQAKEKMRASKLKRFKCLETGFISSNTGLTKYQKRRNIDTSKRIEIN